MDNRGGSDRRGRAGAGGDGGERVFGRVVTTGDGLTGVGEGCIVCVVSIGY